MQRCYSWYITSPMRILRQMQSIVHQSVISYFCVAVTASETVQCEEENCLRSSTALRPPSYGNASRGYSHRYYSRSSARCACVRHKGSSSVSDRTREQWRGQVCLLSLFRPGVKDSPKQLHANRRNGCVGFSTTSMAMLMQIL